ncbi:cyanophycinase [Natronospira sp.]|uniref:cyanophycinase n=1 Tax=Natronospira sp. TaxID=2024970 RepID=UPI003873B1A9
MKTRQRLAFIAFAALLLTACGPQPLQENDNPENDIQWSLLLAGGSISLCSSRYRSACDDERRDEADWPTSAHTATVYRLDRKRLKRILDPAYWQEKREPQRAKLEQRLKASLKSGSSDFAHKELRELIPDELSPRERDRVIDLLEAFSEDPARDGERAREWVSAANTREHERPAIYQEFVEMASAVSGRDQPRILVFTSAARDPLSVVDYYLGAFEQSGAEARWAPTGPAVHAATRAGECDDLDQWRAGVSNAWNRAHIYPDLAAKQTEACLNPDTLTSLMDWADGVFFNGGDQSRHRATLFKDERTAGAALTRLRERFQAEALVVGGTSAGTAVQTGQDMAMIASGTPEAALRGNMVTSPPPAPDCGLHGDCPEGTDPDTLTWQQAGGLGLFSFGLLDTHYGERGRPVRSIALAAATGADLSFGVDETTGLLVGQSPGGDRHFHVLGAAAAMIMDFRESTLSLNESGLAARNVLLHRLTSGNGMTIDAKGRFHIAPESSTEQASCDSPSDADLLGDQGVAKMAGKLRCSKQARLTAEHHASPQRWQIELEETEQTQWLSADRNQHVGWYGLSLSLGPESAADSKRGKEARK